MVATAQGARARRRGRLRRAAARHRAGSTVAFSSAGARRPRRAVAADERAGQVAPSSRSAPRAAWSGAAHGAGAAQDPRARHRHHVQRARDGDAVVAFQKAYRLPRTYVVDGDDWRKLDGARAGQAALREPRRPPRGRQGAADPHGRAATARCSASSPVSTGATGNTPEGSLPHPAEAPATPRSTATAASCSATWASSATSPSTATSRRAAVPGQPRLHPRADVGRRLGRTTAVVRRRAAVRLPLRPSASPSSGADDAPDATRAAASRREQGAWGRRDRARPTKSWPRYRCSDGWSPAGTRAVRRPSRRSMARPSAQSTSWLATPRASKAGLTQTQRSASASSSASTATNPAISPSASATNTSARSSSFEQLGGVVALRVAGALGERVQRLLGEQHEHAAVVVPHGSGPSTSRVPWCASG